MRWLGVQVPSPAPGKRASRPRGTGLPAAGAGRSRLERPAGSSSATTCTSRGRSACSARPTRRAVSNRVSPCSTIWRCIRPRRGISPRSSHDTSWPTIRRQRAWSDSRVRTGRAAATCRPSTARSSITTVHGIPLRRNSRHRRTSRIPPTGPWMSNRRSNAHCSPRSSFSGSAAVPSTVEVYAGGVHLFSQDVQPGPFTITGVPLVSGAGTARIVVSDGTM